MRPPGEPGAKEGDRRVLQGSAIPVNSPHSLQPPKRFWDLSLRPRENYKHFNVKEAITPAGQSRSRAVLPAWWPDKAREALLDSPFRPPGPKVCQRPVPGMAAEGDTQAPRRRQQRSPAQPSAPPSI